MLVLYVQTSNCEVYTFVYNSGQVLERNCSGFHLPVETYHKPKQLSQLMSKITILRM